MLESHTNAQKTYSLISNKNLSQKIPSSGWHSRLGNLGQKGLKPTTCDVAHKKRNPKFSNFLKCKLEDSPHLKVTSTCSQSAGEQ